MLEPDYADIRDAVRALCADFPGSYWRDLDARMEYPTAFVDALTRSGFLAALIPEEFGGSGLLWHSKNPGRYGEIGGRLPIRRNDTDWIPQWYSFPPLTFR